jgi:hypothetical protein
VATAHHHSDEWIAIQRDRLERHLPGPFRVWGSLENVDASYERFFDVVVPSLGQHAGKLNLLAHHIVREAADDDLILFLDGDAFPVADLGPAMAEALASHDLWAVQRLENFGDRQPHPCFCVVPVQVWRDLPGDWVSGHPIRPGRTDVGANLLWLLESQDRPWAPLLRTHSLTDHSLLYAIYGGLVYHHGAGFRGLKPPGQDRAEWTSRIPETALERDRMERMRTKHPEKYTKLLAAMMEAAVQSQAVYETIRDDPEFFEAFLES